MNVTDTQLYEALRERVGKVEAELLINTIKARVESEVSVQTRGLATSERVAQLETSLVREFNNKLLVYSIGTVTATVISLVVLAQYFLK
ncbi:MAG: hypothetical protein INR69_24315 [Mucilaginibacter polytrichastri]|nr:hypothetical protein [Mucilaginibacter polytrichastri]